MTLVPSCHGAISISRKVIVIRNGKTVCVKGGLDRVLFAPELEFPKILVFRLPENSSNVNTECAGILFYYSGINLFLIDYARCKLCNMWLLLFNNNSMIINIQQARTGRKTLLQLLLKTDDR